MFIITVFRKIISLVVLALVFEICTCRANILFGRYIDEKPIGISPMANDKVRTI